MTDEDPEGKLKNYCYDHCDENSSNEIKNSRGLVYKNDKPFLKSFGYTPQYTINTIDDITSQFIKNNIKHLKFFDSYEGTLLRLFYNDINDKWYLSTHRKLNAEKSKWGSNETFGNKFNSIIPENFYDNLNKDYNYIFILTPNENNRIVCKTVNLIFHIGTYDKNFALSTEYDIGIPKPYQYTFESWEQFTEQIEQHTDITKTQGIIIHCPGTQTNVKMMNTKYHEYFNVRNNVPSIMFRYLQIRTDEEMVKKMIFLYPSHHEKFMKYETFLADLSGKLFTNYMNRFVKRIYTTVSPEENSILKKCHEWHLLNKATNKMTLQRVTKTVNEMPATLLNKIIKQYNKNN